MPGKGGVKSGPGAARRGADKPKPPKKPRDKKPARQEEVIPGCRLLWSFIDANPGAPSRWA